jgi:hypothetical protein
MRRGTSRAHTRTRACAGDAMAVATEEGGDCGGGDCDGDDDAATSAAANSAGGDASVLSASSSAAAAAAAPVCYSWGRGDLGCLLHGDLEDHGATDARVEWGRARHVLQVRTSLPALVFCWLWCVLSFYISSEAPLIWACYGLVFTCTILVARTLATCADCVQHVPHGGGDGDGGAAGVWQQRRRAGDDCNVSRACNTMNYLVPVNTSCSR